MIKYCSYVIKSAVVLLIATVLGLLVLTVVYMLPTERIWSHVQESRISILSESTYFQLTPNVGGSVFDNYTEAIYLNMALVGDNDNVIHTALESKLYGVLGEFTPQENLEQALNYDENTELIKGSYRFWNGYMVFVKPLLMFFTYPEIRSLNLIFQSLLMFLLMSIMNNKGLGKYNLSLLLTYLFLNPICISMNMTFAGYFYCTIIPCILMLLFNNKLIQRDLYVYYFLILGICVIDFNMNYFQIISFGIPMALYFVLNSWPKNLKEFLETGITFFCAWFLGYAGMMVMKWIVYAMFVSPEIFSEMIESIVFRTSSAFNEVEFSRLEAIKRNLREVWTNIGWLLTEAVFVLGCIVQAIRNKVNFKIYGKQLIVVAIITIVPIVRYIIFANHVYIHYWTTYRCFAMSVFAINVFLVDINKNTKRKLQNEIHKNNAS